MNKTAFAKHIADSINCTEDQASTVVEVFTESLLSAISEGNSVHIEKLGRFGSSFQKERKFYSLKTGRVSKIPAHTRAVFKADKDLKMAVR